MDKAVLSLYQLQNGYCYNSDSLFLYAFITRFLKREVSVLDIGAGCGILGLLCARDFGVNLSLIDIDESNAKLCKKNADFNNLNAEIFCDNVIDLPLDSPLNPRAGDLALKTAANVVRGCIRQTDALVRFGGDEFLLILPGIPEDYLKVKLEQIREKLHEAIVPGYAHMRLSVSVGGVVQGPADEMDRVVRQADRLMYQAKLRKNTVVVDGGSITPAEGQISVGKA